MIVPPIGARTAVLISDPWDVVEGMKSNPFTARVVAVAGTMPEPGAILLQVEVPFYVDNARCEWFVARRRHHEPSSGPRPWLECGYNLTRISSEDALSSEPFRAQSWRGGVALLGTLMLLEQQAS